LQKKHQFGEIFVWLPQNYLISAKPDLGRQRGKKNKRKYLFWQDQDGISAKKNTGPAPSQIVGKEQCKKTIRKRTHTRCTVTET
jgi:hypothetical protein